MFCSLVLVAANLLNPTEFLITLLTVALGRFTTLPLVSNVTVDEEIGEQEEVAAIHHQC